MSAFVAFYRGFLDFGGGGFQCEIGIADDTGVNFGKEPEFRQGEVLA